MEDAMLEAESVLAPLPGVIVSRVSLLYAPPHGEDLPRR